MLSLFQFSVLLLLRGGSGPKVWEVSSAMAGRVTLSLLIYKLKMVLSSMACLRLPEALIFRSIACYFLILHLKMIRATQLALPWLPSEVVPSCWCQQMLSTQSSRSLALLPSTRSIAFFGWLLRLLQGC